MYIGQKVKISIKDPVLGSKSGIIVNTYKTLSHRMYVVELEIDDGVKIDVHVLPKNLVICEHFNEQKKDIEKGIFKDIWN